MSSAASSSRTGSGGAFPARPARRLAARALRPPMAGLQHANAPASARVEQLESQVAELHRLAQELNKQPGKEEEATRVYKELAALDDQALAIRLSAATPPTATAISAAAQASPEYYAALPPPASWAGPEQRRRALGAVLGAALADAAACGCQWVYSLEAMERLAAARPGLEFFDPPQCPFFEYPLGHPSPYAEQAAVLLQSLAEAGRLDCIHYAAAVYAAFGPGFGSYRDRSTKSFLRRYAAGALPPRTGSPDDQANAFARLPPLVALYASGRGGEEERQRLVAAAARMIRVTQDDDVAVAFGVAAALILDAVVGGATAAAAVSSTVDWLRQQQRKQADGEAAADANAGNPEAAPAALWGEVADRLLQAAELALLPPLEAATRLGRNCHLPNSLQTPLQVLLHLELRQWQQAAQPGSAAGQPAIDDDSPAADLPAAAGAAADGGDDSCLPCSMGACPLPSSSLADAAVAGSAVLAGLLEQQQQRQQQEAPALSSDAFVQAVRLAIRPGGCCASRAGFVGALVGALGGELPADWPSRMLGWSELEQQAQRLVALRD